MTDTPETDNIKAQEMKTKSCRKCSPQGKRCDCPTESERAALGPWEVIDRIRRERDEWKAKYIQQNKDLRCEQMDPNGTIWDYAKELQAKLDEARKWSATLADAGDEIRAQLREEQRLHVQTLNELDDARVLCRWAFPRLRAMCHDHDATGTGWCCAEEMESHPEIFSSENADVEPLSERKANAQ